MSRLSTLLSRAIPYLKFFLLPLLITTYPAIFHYGNNALIAGLASLWKLLGLLAGIALVFFGLFYVINHRRAVESALSVTVFLLFFHTYGLVFSALRAWDVVQVEHYTLLPVFILLGLYFAWFTSHINDTLSKRIWAGAVIILGVLFVFNLVKIVPVEVRKMAARNQKTTTATSNPAFTAGLSYPDIYYLVFDEMAGFEAMRQYWHYDSVDQFVDFLKAEGFYVVEGSHSETPSTFHELAIRLNYQTYPYDPSDPRGSWNDEFQKMGNNKVMQYLKTLGYTTIVFDEFPVGSPNPITFDADLVYTIPPSTLMEWGDTFDEFGKLVLDNTMVLPFLSSQKIADPALEQHKRMITFSMNQVSNSQAPSPKFIYLHLIVPHMPFMFAADGGKVDPLRQSDWDQYLGTYIYSIHVAEEMIENIQAASNSKIPPVIILQSDHGARNTPEGRVVLDDYPLEYITLIVNALYLPGCEDAPLTQDMNPINTFPIVFNCYFDANIPLK